MSDYPDELRTKIDSDVSLSGVATDYKAGAAIVLDAGGSILLGGMHAWSATLRGRRVTVSGTLRHLAAPTQQEAQVQTVGGERWWLDNPKVEGR